VAPDRRISIADKDRRHGGKSRAKTCNGCKEPFVLDLDSKVTRAVVVCPAHEPEEEAVELGAEARERGQGLLQLDSDLGDMASPRMAQWAAQGVSIIARPWPHGGARLTKHDCPLDFAHGTGPCPHGQPVPMTPGRDAQCPANAGDACPVRVQCTKARIGQGRSLTIREDEPCQQRLRATLQAKRGRASLRNRTAVEQAISPHWAH
jgi:hypothetical protein